jgi:dihydroorotate dehydrogenase electron transfer subunit
MFNLKLSLQQNQKIFTYYRLFSFIDSHIARAAQPGQFLMIRVTETYEPFLPRPMSVHRIIKNKKGEAEGFQVLFKIAGKGTKLLAEKTEGEQLQILGPLGKGFRIDKTCSEALIVAGGIGVAPMVFLIEELARTSAKIKAFIGGATSQDLPALNIFKKHAHDLFITTEDGSQGKKGMITESFEKYLTNGNKAKNSIIYACGPKGMLKQVASLSNKYKLPCQLSFESRMACGLGACLGCVIKTKSGHNNYHYKRVCVEGPVFNAQEVIW